jgi:hypothetical protein
LKDPKEIQIAWEIWNLVNKLNDFLWDRYEEGFLEIYLKEEDHKFLSTLDAAYLPKKEEKENASD